MENITHSVEETKALATLIASKLKPGDVVALYGTLGAGKTTFTGHLVKALGMQSRVQSPTFVIHRKYDHINHLDLYRITSEEELKDLGLLEMFSDQKAITLIEWPEIAEKYLPEKSIKITFEYIDENSRKINVQNLH